MDPANIEEVSGPIPEWAEDTDSFIDHLEVECPEIFRTAYWPRTLDPALDPKQRDEPSRLSSKFGGLPWYSRKYPVPRCRGCLMARTLLCQLDLAKLPEAFRKDIGRESGLFQAFFSDCLCAKDPRNCHARIIPESAYQARLNNLLDQTSRAVALGQQPLQDGDLPQHLKNEVLWLRGEKKHRGDTPKMGRRHPPPPDGGDEEESFESEEETEETVLKEMIIKDWLPRVELPEPYYEMSDTIDRQSLADRFDVDRMILHNLVEMMVPDHDDGVIDIGNLDHLERNQSGNGIKIGGYVPWLMNESDSAGVRYPWCSKCRRSMNKVIIVLQNHPQILDIEFGNEGVAYVCGCPVPGCSNMRMSWVSQ